MPFQILFLKKSDTPSGSRWITVNGGDGHGQHVLVSGEKVVAGAGGSLNGKTLSDSGTKQEDSKPAPPAYKYGDHVAFENGEHKGHGKVLGIGRDGATIRDAKGGVHNLHHEHITHLHQPGEGDDHNTPPAAGPDEKPTQENAADQKTQEGLPGKNLTHESSRKMKNGNTETTSAIMSGSGKKVGFSEIEESDKAVTMRVIKIEDEASQGKGYALSAYRDMIDYAMKNGKTFESDKEVSASARKVYDRLEKQGYKIERSTDVTEDNYGRLYSKNKGPVFRVTGTPMAKAVSARVLFIGSRL